MSLKITFINVGYGEAILLEYEKLSCPEDTFTMLIDGGSNEPEEYDGQPGRITALEYLRKAGIVKLDIVLNTHIHEDHTCGLESIIKENPVDNFWYAALPWCERQILPSFLAATPANGRFLEALNAARRMHIYFRDKNVPLKEIRQSFQPIQLCEDVFIDILGPSADRGSSFVFWLNRLYQEQSFEKAQQLLAELDVQMNNVSTMVRIRYQNRSILLVGDTNREGYTELLTRPELLKADVFKLGHHGQQDSITPAILKVVDPCAAVICASNDFRYNSTSSATLQMLTEHGKRRSEPLSIVPTDQTNILPYLTDVPPHDAVIFTISETGELHWHYSICNNNAAL